MRFAIGMGLILLVLGTATIGYMLMDHGMSADHARCVTADITGSGSCFQGNVLPDSVVTAFAVSFLLLVLGTFAIGENSSPERRAAERFVEYRKEISNFFNSARLNLIAYLAFHELSPSFA